MTLDEIRAAQARTMKMSPDEFRDAVNNFAAEQIAADMRAENEAALVKLHRDLQERIRTGTASAGDVEQEVKARVAIMTQAGMDAETAGEIARHTVAQRTTRTRH